MKNLKDAKTKLFPSKTRGGKELPSSSALDSPSVISKLATPPHAINPDTPSVRKNLSSKWTKKGVSRTKIHLDTSPFIHFDDKYFWTEGVCRKLLMMLLLL